MQNKIALIAGGLLGLLFIVFGLNFFLHFIPMPSPAEGTPAAAFMGAMYGSSYLTFVKVLEILGGILVAVPKTRNIGLLVLGPIVINILAFNTFVAPGGLTQPPVILVAVLSAFLLWAGRSSFAKLVN
ncbi:hypothetical protein OAE25_01040 [Verrucomicrobiales bacterium]|nr:hypothetical protein [Verrucomicrobiales bacterium]MDB4657718.1 hypothetical protein [Verrucomicrobiales bacterium]MDC0276113.1 hypothetical protein [Verrucomicrobiales bacterium]MDC0322816.1 hypothetical protein [Verrucomicrobiales bacterium]